MISRQISKRATDVMQIGARPWHMWTPIAVLTQVKRIMPKEFYEQAKRLYLEGDSLIDTISPIVFANYQWRDGEIYSHYMFSPFRFFLHIGREDLAKRYKRLRAGSEFDVTDAKSANSGHHVRVI